MRDCDTAPQRHLVVLSNNRQIPALSVARLDKRRWQVELFLRWSKPHRRRKHCFGTSGKAVRAQIWMSVAVDGMSAIRHKPLKRPGTLHSTLQIVSVDPFEKRTRHERLTETPFNPLIMTNSNQWKLC